MTSLKAVIRPATVADLDALMDIEEGCYGFPWSRRQFCQELDNPAATIDLLVSGDDVAGYLCSWLVCDEMQILNLATAPHWRRQGVARLLLDYVLTRASAAGAVNVWLEVRIGNLAATTLYRQHGFAEQGRRSRYYPDGEDALIMRREL